MQQNQPLEHHTAKQSHLAIVYSQRTLLLTYILLLFLVFLMDMLAVFIIVHPAWCWKLPDGPFRIEKICQ
jgi:hypothetical protein